MPNEIDVLFWDLQYERTAGYPRDADFFLTEDAYWDLEFFGDNGKVISILKSY